MIKWGFEMATRREFFRHSAGAIATAALAGGTAGQAETGSNPVSLPANAPKDYAAKLHAAREAIGVTGASFAYWDGTTLHSATSGLRNSVTRDPVTTDTLMHLGSITKVMNAALLMQLVDEGRVALDDPILKHLPDLRLGDMKSAARITCRMLVNHTSGIDGAWLPEYGPDQERIVDTVDRCAALGQLFPPGAETSYNNVATVIAGYLVQKVRGRSWYRLAKEKIYDPLGMRHALVDPLDAPRFRVSVGDLTDAASGKLVQTTRAFLATSLAPAGSTQMASAIDTVAFARALINDGVGPNGNRIVSARSARTMATPSAAFAPIGAWADEVGLGWMIQPGGVLSHGGSGPGVRSKLYAHPPSGRAMALLTNSDNGDQLIETFMDPIMRSWTGISPVEPPVDGRPVNLAPYVGVYEDIADRYRVDREADGLALRTADKFLTYDNSSDDKPPFFLEPIGNDTFRARADTPPADQRTIRFLRPRPDGKMQFVSSWGKLMARSG